MTRRLSKTAAVVTFVLALSLSAPSAFAAPQRDRGGDPDWGTRIIRIVKSVIHHFVPSSLDDIFSTVPPKP